MFCGSARVHPLGLDMGVAFRRAGSAELVQTNSTFLRVVVVVYRQHVAHRHHDDDHEQQDVWGRPAEPGLHPDRPGTAQDGTDGESTAAAGSR